ncbi:MAG: sugar phosphate isomerase/epimerase [Gammaproteobacteria bacterium]|nr:sugar phosphate isomerase/epimerase [Gammaproteobacteria bacterium]MBU1554299.1 sugar phosphate isomerase/epimerase [Gammaproteobacteria bacterium]MBU2070463.1 sugar phosphate isomerase/epimerase [Gammaproteobacteria bacterium]MBU2185264.1 sugar phosphate isomerase/epimerase [Gammaproteobacteria bacterium]MBU2205055.1 sugar phosphate isomerase/epimerase [Gammaproteobacteria bacterium]
MKLSVCTISFRHQLISIAEIASFARQNHFQGIELWGAHAKNLAEQPQYDQHWLADYGLKTSMLSDYLPLLADEAVLYHKVQLLARLARHWGSEKIRTFAGAVGSSCLDGQQRHALFSRLQLVCDWLAPHGINLVIETHPNTYADSVSATLELFAAVNRNNMQLNFDVLHVWESGADIIAALDALQGLINHFHFKNISDATHLSVFAPDNVYAAAGSREGMAPIFDGVVDYAGFIDYLQQHPNARLRNLDASLEWFGNHCKKVLGRDRYLLQLQQQHNQSSALVLPGA